jgi:hypothetical protein
MSLFYQQITNISAINYTYPELDVACFEDLNIVSHPAIIPDLSYNHRVVLADIDVSANIFKKLFYNTAVTGNFNTLTGNFTDHTFGLLAPPPSTTDVSHVLDDATSALYYGKMSQYISLLPPARRKYPSNDAFSLQDELLDNIILDLSTAHSTFLGLFNTCSFIGFTKEMAGIKTLNNLIPSSTSTVSCSLNWNDILELVRAEYDEVVDTVNNWTSTEAIAILKLTLVIKTTLNLSAMGVDDLVSTSEVVLRFKVNFSETNEFIAWSASHSNPAAVTPNAIPL